MVVDNFLENVDNIKKIVENYLFMTKLLQKNYNFYSLYNIFSKNAIAQKRKIKIF